MALVFFLIVTVNQLVYIAVFQISNFFAILNRIASILQLENYSERHAALPPAAGSGEEEHKTERGEVGGYIKIQNASYNWGFRLSDKLQGQQHNQVNLLGAAEENVLSEMNFELQPGDLMIVVGTVGSGKSSLLHALMHETNQTGGTHVVRGSLAYVEQEPFIFSASIRDNVCFGLEYDAARFEVAVRMS